MKLKVVLGNIQIESFIPENSLKTSQKCLKFINHFLATFYCFFCNLFYFFFRMSVIKGRGKQSPAATAHEFPQAVHFPQFYFECYFVYHFFQCADKFSRNRLYPHLPLFLSVLLCSNFRFLCKVFPLCHKFFLLIFRQAFEHILIIQFCHWCAFGK